MGLSELVGGGVNLGEICVKDNDQFHFVQLLFVAQVGYV